MNFKKFAAAGASAVLFLSAATPAFAFWWNSDDVTVGNRAYVRNTVITKADSGDNSIHGKYVWGGKILTGDASAGADVFNQVNTVDLGCGCLDGDLTVWNKAYVKNFVYTKADSGDNEIHGKVVAGGRIWTGDAAAGAIVTNIVNTTVSGDGEVL